MDREVVSRDLLIVRVSMHTLTHLHAALFPSGKVLSLSLSPNFFKEESLLISHQPRLVNHLRAAVGIQ